MLLGTTLALGCAVCWLFANVTIRGAGARFGAGAALFWSQLLTLPLAFGAAVALEGAPPRLDATAGALAVAGGLAAVLAYGGLFVAMSRARLSVAAPIISAWSALAVVGALLFLEERLGLATGLGVALVLLGNVALARLEGRGARAAGGDASGLLAAIVSAFGFAAMMTAVKLLGERSGPAWAVPLVWSIELALLGPLLILRGRRSRRPRSLADLRLALLPGLFELAGFVLISLAAAAAPLAVVGPVSGLSTALSVGWGVLVLGERLPRSALLAAGAASLGVVLVNLG